MISTSNLFAKYCIVVESCFNLAICCSNNTSIASLEDGAFNFDLNTDSVSKCSSTTCPILSAISPRLLGIRPGVNGTLF